MEKKTVQRVMLFLIAACIFAFAVISLQPPPDGWLEEDGSTFYILDGKPVTGWKAIEDTRFYFGEDGVLHHGWLTMDGNTYYLDSGSGMTTGWLELNGDRYYMDRNGIRVYGWQIIGGLRYYLDDSGKLATGVVATDRGTYLFDAQGLIHRGWIQINGNTYYGDEDGHPVYGWTEIDGKQHYFHETGAAASGWQNLDGFTYYFYTDGAPAQGKLTIDGKTHFFASNGQQMILVNPWNSLPEDYAVELMPINETHYVAAIAYQDYLDMVEDCEAAGFAPVVCSSYRTHEYQDMLFQNRIQRYIWKGYSEEEATELAGHVVAVPGTSEHQLGLALDIVDAKNLRLDESQAKMPTQKWLMENSWRYGWILRYPNEKSELTGIIYEPWHYRYVGKTIAKEIFDLGLCLEEYLDMLTDSVG